MTATREPIPAVGDRLSDDAEAGRLAAQAAMDDRPFDDRFTDVFAEAAIRELGRLIAELPAKIKDSVAGGREAAEALSRDPLQGLAEVVQNADDQQASSVRIGLVDGPTGARLLVSHDGGRLRLDHLLAMVLPWVSTKRDDDRATGRFGIGLSTLRSIGDNLEIHCAPYHAELADGKLRPIPPAEAIPGIYDVDPEQPATLIAVPVRPGTVLTSLGIRDWLSTWGSAALLFLESVQRVVLVDTESASSQLELRLRHAGQVPRSFTIAGHTVTARVDEVTDPATERRWLRYVADIPAPAGVARARKKTGGTTPVGLAVPLGQAEAGGLLHAGLPLVETRLPWSANAQFDPDTSRGHIRSTPWNRSLIELLSGLWLAVTQDMFSTRPVDAWRTVPLAEEVICSSDDWLERALQEEFLQRARPAFAEHASVAIREAHVSLSDLAYPAPDLGHLVDDGDVGVLAPGRVVLPEQLRPDDGRWWSVLTELSLGEGIGIDQGLDLLVDEAVDGRPPAWFIGLAATAITGGAADGLCTRPSVVLDDGDRVQPPLRGDDPRVLVPAEAPSSLQARAGLTRRMHAAYAEDSEEARVVLDWLSERGAFSEEELSAEDAVARVAVAPRATLPLDNDSLLAFRDLFATLSLDSQEKHGRAVGRVLVVDAELWTDAGTRVTERATPDSCYQPRAIDHDPGGWPTAAGRTPGIRWVARSYAEVLRSESGRAGLGAQRFFTLLGVERSPRLVEHPQGELKYGDPRRAVPMWAVRTPSSRREELRHVDVDKPYVIDDLVSPDLELVLASIRAEPSRERRRRRASALLSTLQRAWDRRYADRAQAAVVYPSRAWQHTGSKVRSWWLARLRDEEWLPDARGQLCAPRDLVLPSEANRAVYGKDGHYADAKLIAGLRDELVTALGITGDPQVTDVLRTLRAIRTEAPEISIRRDLSAWQQAAARAYPMYQLLADWLAPNRRRRMDVSVPDMRRWFASGEGLILTDQGWRTPGDVFSGPPVFGELRSFAPHDPSLGRLWRELGVREPTAADCAQVLREISGRTGRDGDVAIELEALRLLDARLGDAAAPVTLRRLPLRTDKGHSGKRPMFAVEDPSLAEVIGRVAQVWTPGGNIGQFRGLFGPLNVTELTAGDFTVVDAHRAAESAADTTLARAALTLLVDEIARDDAGLSASASTAAALAADLVVHRHATLRLSVDLTGHPVVVEALSFLDAETGVLHIRDGDEIGDWAVGGTAIATLFSGDRRKVAYAWAAMWSRAEAGERKKALVLAEQRAAERSAALMRFGRDLSSAAPGRNSSPAGRTTAPRHRRAPSPEARPPRLLIDPSELADGPLVVRRVNAGGKAEPPTPKAAVRLQQPVDRGPSPARSPGAAPAGYTDREREDVGAEVLRLLLERHGDQLNDVRDQMLVGADLVDGRGRYFELKVFAGAAQNSVSLQASEVARARDHDFYLVIVSNVERGAGTPEVRIIADPLHRLAEVTDGSITLSGVHQAEALVVDVPLSGPST